MRVTTLLILTFALGATIGFGCSEATKQTTPDASVEADVGGDASVQDAATPDADAADASEDSDAGSNTDLGE